MKVYTVMPAALKPYFKKELGNAAKSMKKKQYLKCWRHLERAHILGQPYPWQHTQVHFRMMKFGIKVKNWKEVFGQIPRLLIGGVKSFVGTIPHGNTGGTNVSALDSMTIPNDLLAIINKTQKK